MQDVTHRRAYRFRHRIFVGTNPVVEPKFRNRRLFQGRDVR
ncbi:MAG TPA: hypothetical protein VM165_00920 [Planctomycetaceae bacterium]|nr:hypothetical protein [Planctomycetaceae bacterium]